MKILVANLGSTSFKYRLFDMDGHRQLARGGVERIGAAQSRVQMEIGPACRESLAHVPDHAVAVRRCLAELTDPDSGCLGSAGEVAAIGFKAIHAVGTTGVQRVTPELIDKMEAMNRVAPAHNPPYVMAMRLLGETMPEMPLVAVFETGFHETIPDRCRFYAVPYEWATELGIKRWGYHGASHRYIGERMGELLGNATARVISCHLGGSSSLCAMRAGKSVATSLGMSPQSGIPHNNRVGEFDPFALPVIMERTGKSLADVLADLAGRSGLVGLSGTSGDIRDLQQAAATGDRRARLALEVYVTAVRNYLGAYLVELGGAEAIAFTGGIGENSAAVRAAVCRDLDPLGIALDPQANDAAAGETCVSAAASRVAVWVVPTNEEIVVARQVRTLLEG